MAIGNDVTLKVGFDIDKFTAELNRTNSTLTSWAGSVKSILGTVGLAFSAQQVASFSLEVSKLAGQAKGVEDAFNRLPNSVRLMNELKDATGGTVSELELMKRAVMASNFDISLEALPRLLQFATLRAQQTGQSVDYLVDSIVTGIGRKSKLILDNLGISAAQLSHELKGASTEASTVGEVADAVGRIAEKALINMAGFSENAATKLQRLSASWENLKVVIGKAANDTGILTGALDTFTDALDILSNEKIPAATKAQLAFFAATNPKLFYDYLKGLKVGAEALDKMALQEERIQNIRARFSADKLIQAYGGVQKAIAGLSSTTQESTDINLKYILNLDDYDKILAELNKRLDENQSYSKKEIVTIGSLKEKIKELNDAYELIDSSKIQELQTNRDLVKTYEQQIAAIKKLTEEKLKAVKVPENNESSLSKAKLSEPASLNSIFGKKSKTLDEAVSETGEKAAAAMAVTENRLAEHRAKIEEFNQAIKDSFIDMGITVLDLVGTKLGDGSFDIGKGLRMALGRFMSHIGKMFIKFGLASKAFEFLRKAIGTPAGIGAAIGMVAAGAALVVAGAAITSSASGGLSGATGGGGGGYSSGGGGIERAAVNGNTQSERRYIIELTAKGSDLKAVIDTASFDNRVRKG